MIELDIPHLSADGIQFGDGCFYYTYSIQSSSNHSLISSSFDAPGLENYLSFGGKIPSSASYVVKNRTELNFIRSDVEDLWIGRFDTTGITEYLFDGFKSIKSLVIGECIFMNARLFSLTG